MLLLSHDDSHPRADQPQNISQALRLALSDSLKMLADVKAAPDALAGTAFLLPSTNDAPSPRAHIIHFTPPPQRVGRLHRFPAPFAHPLAPLPTRATASVYTLRCIRFRIPASVYPLPCIRFRMSASVYPLPYIRFRISVLSRLSVSTRNWPGKYTSIRPAS